MGQSLDQVMRTAWRFTGNWCARNHIEEGWVYLQISRGALSDRDFVFPPEDTPQTVVLFTQAKPGLCKQPDGADRDQA